MKAARVHVVTKSRLPFDKKKKDERKRKKLIRRNKVRPSQEKVNVMIAFYKILTAPRKKRSA